MQNGHAYNGFPKLVSRLIFVRAVFDNVVCWVDVGGLYLSPALFVHFKAQTGNRGRNFVRASVDGGDGERRGFVDIRAAYRVPKNTKLVGNCLAVVFTCLL